MKKIYPLALALAVFAAGPAFAQVVDAPAEPAVEDPVDPAPSPEPAPSSASVREFLDAGDAQEILALNSALSLPAWLENGERFSVSGGVGFSDGATAFGATGIVRLQGSVSGFAGAAVSEGGEWAGKAGLRAGF